ncbi:MAG: sigma factor, partial [Bacteroidota bacterium]
MASSQEITNVEKDIVALFRRKDSQALRLIDQHYQRALVGVIMRVVKTEAFAQDVWQESLVKIWKNSHTYDPEKGRLFT